MTATVARCTALSGAETEEEEDQHDCYDLDMLVQHGIVKTDINKFKDAGISTVVALMQTCRKNLLAVKGITDAKVDKFQEACKKVCNFGFHTGAEFAMKRQKVKKVSTGVKGLDSILGGGIETGSITQVYGEYRTGKTQLVHTLCVTGMLPKQDGGGGGRVLLLDTEGGFRPEKIDGIAERFGVNPADVLRELVIARVWTSDHLIQCIKEASGVMLAEGPFSMVIVDSATSLFRVDYQGRGELSTRQQNLNLMLSMLSKLAENFNCAVFITNQVMSNPDGGMSFVSDPKKAVGGHVMSHACTTILELKKGRGDCRIAKIIDSPDRAEAEATFQITTKGVQDPSE